MVRRVEVLGRGVHALRQVRRVGLGRLVGAYPKAVWLNPVPERYWGGTRSIGMIREIMNDRMYPLTLEGLDRAMRKLTR